MVFEHLYSGSALGKVDEQGAVALPGFVTQVLERSSGGRRVMLGAHETDPCLMSFDPARLPSLHGDLERRRLLDESAGAPASEHHARARRLFGLAEEAECDSENRIVLPPLARRRGRIGGLALFVGTGATFEIWDPETARTSESGSLREIAEYQLEQAGVQTKEREGEA